MRVNVREEAGGARVIGLEILANGEEAAALLRALESAEQAQQIVQAPRATSTAPGLEPARKRVSS